MVMGLVSAGRRRTGNRASTDDGNKSDVDDDTQIMEPDQGNVLSHIISQLRPGADLSRVVLPTFILEPRSMLERITNFMCHPEMLLHIPTIDDPTERFVSVVKFYLSGWHIRPPGVKKPLNPVLGEIFSCYWDLEDKTRAYYISEQTSHHPPKSSYFYMAPDHHIRIDGTLKPRSKFLGNSAASMMEGIAYLSLLNRGSDSSKGERYIITQPNMYARGILFGKMKYELGDHSFVRCPELDLTADVDFKTKGWVGGTYNAIGGSIKRESTGEVLFELSGMWNEEMFIKDMATGHREMFFNATRAKPSSPQVRPIAEQEERESQRLWELTAKAVKERNHEVATDEKTKIEDRQREEAAARAETGEEWKPRLFRSVRAGHGEPEEGEEDLEWIIDANIDTSVSPEEQAKQIMDIYPVINGQKLGEPVSTKQAEDSKETQPPATEPAAQPVAQPDVQPTAPPATQPAAQSAAQSAATPTPPPPASAPPRSVDNLIDFSGDAAPAQPPQSPQPPAQAKQPDEIETMLQQTGKPAEGALLDFTEDMRKDLPHNENNDSLI